MGKDLLGSYKSYAGSAKRFSLIMGIWPSKKPTIFYRLLPYFIGIVFSIISCTSMNFAYINIHNLNRMMKGVSISLSYFNATIKMICYRVHRQKFSDLNDNINQLLRRHQGDEQLLSRILSAFTFFKKFSALLIFTAFYVVGAWFITPLTMMINQYRHGVTPIEYLLPFPAVYPYHISGGSGLYIIHYVMETYGCFCLFFIAGSIENSFSLYSSQIIGQLRALTYEMKYFTFKSGYEKKLQELIEIHRRLIHCCEMLQTIHGPIVLSMFVTTAIILCCLIFQIKQMQTISIKQLMVFFFYISVKLLQTLIYAWAGMLITTECENFRDEVYGIGWEKLGKKSAGYYVCVIMMQKPICLKACSYTPISINLFTGIVNTALSYFFLLQTLDDKQ